MRSFFGDIPLELRILIYKELLTTDTAVDVLNPKLREYIGKDGNNDLHPAILRTCKQAYAEGLHLLYEDNCLRFEFVGTPTQWFSTQKFERIKHVSSPCTLQENYLLTVGAISSK